MGRHWLVLASIVALAFGALGRLAVAQNPDQTAHRVHVLTPEKNGEVVRARLGDEVILRLPMQMPFTWGLIGETRVLREIKKPLKLEPVNEGNRQDQVVGSPQVFEVHYRVVAEPKDETLQWVYCYLGRTNDGGVPVQPIEPLKPGELPAKKGTYFRIRLLPAS